LRSGCTFLRHRPSRSAGRRGAEINIWVVVKPDDTCVIRIARSEMGQGTRTGLAQLVPKSSSATGRRSHRIDHARPEPRRKRAWGEMGTGGSRGIRTSQDYVRRGGAAARMMLLQAAANSGACRSAS
jgi:isoquinoline 1-oxidoreductase beta subunit